MFSKGSEQQMRFWRHDSESWNQSWDLNCIVVWSTITLVSACPNFVNSLLPFNLSSLPNISHKKRCAFFCPHQIGTCKQNFSTLGPQKKLQKLWKTTFLDPFVLADICFSSQADLNSGEARWFKNGIGDAYGGYSRVSSALFQSVDCLHSPSEFNFLKRSVKGKP